RTAPGRPRKSGAGSERVRARPPVGIATARFGQLVLGEHTWFTDLAGTQVGGAEPIEQPKVFQCVFQVLTQDDTPVVGEQRRVLSLGGLDRLVGDFSGAVGGV